VERGDGRKSEVETFFARLAAGNPTPRSELVFHDPYTLLVAVVLSAQATDKSVNAATKSLFALADTPEKMLALGEEGLKASIKTIGLFNGKARNIIAFSRLLLERHGGRVPGNRADLEDLPGVGRKSANVVLNVAFGQPVIAVDTHIFRLCNRSGLAPGKTPLDVERALETTVPPLYRQHAHHWLILHGRYVCTARKPKCEECCVRDLCAYILT